MTVETTDRTQNFAGAQSVLTFTFTASPDRPEDIKVKETVIATGVETDLVKDTDYTVSVNADGVGGTVTISPTFAATSLMTVFRETTKTQTSDYDDYNNFPADTLEANLDQVTMLNQESDEDLGRAAKFPISYTGSTLNLPVPEADKIIGYNSDATAFENKDDPGTSAAAAAASASSASTSATNAATSETNASNSASSAATSATAASNSAASIDPANITITGGTIDDVSIGATTHSTGKFTTVEATTSIKVTGVGDDGVVVTGIKDEDNMASDSAVHLATQQSIKAYADSLGGANVFAGSFTKDTSTGGTTSISSFGFTPKGIVIIGCQNSSDEAFWGVDSTSQTGGSVGHDGTNDNFQANSSIVFAMENSTTTMLEGSVAFDADGITITWTKTGSPTGTLNVKYIAIG